MSDYKFYDNQRIAKGDILLIPFGDKVPSVYRVLKANKRSEILEVVVLKDTYKTPVASGTKLNIAKAIYEGYWCFVLIKHKGPNGGPVKTENP